MHYEITAQSRVLLGQLRVPQLVKKLPALYGTQGFITICTTASHLSLAYARAIQSTSIQPVSCNIILPSTHRSRKCSLSFTFP